MPAQPDYKTTTDSYPFYLCQINCIVFQVLAYLC